MSDVNKNTETVQDELREKIKATALRPLADRFLELAREIDSGDYIIPKSIADAEVITEGYINQAYERIEKILNHQLSLKDTEHAKAIELARLEARLGELNLCDVTGLPNWYSDYLDERTIELTKRKEEIENDIA